MNLEEDAAGVGEMKRVGVRYLSSLEAVQGLTPRERRHLEAVAAKYKFRANDYYLGLVDWGDPADPIRRIVIPNEGEAAEWGRLDASNEGGHTVLPGVQSP